MARMEEDSSEHTGEDRRGDTRTWVFEMHKDGGDLEKKKDGGEEGACIVPPVAIPAQVETKTCEGDGKERADGRGDWERMVAFSHKWGRGRALC